MPIKSPFQYIVLIVVICFGLHSCKEENSQTKYIPLLDRKDTLGKSSEWINVQTQFKDNMLAIEKDTNNYMAQLKLAEIYLNEARIGGNQTYYYHGALRMLNALIENKSAKPDFIFLAMTYKASVLLSLHQFTEAKKIAEAAYSINQNNADVLGALVDASVELGNYTNAISYCDKMMMLRPDLRSYSRVSYLRQIHGENQGAIDAMKMAIEAGSTGFEATEWARINLGDLYLNTGKLDTAKYLYEAALYYRPNYAYAEIGLAKVAMASKQYDTALVHCKQAIRILSESSFVALMADIYALKGDSIKATEVRQDVLNLIKRGEAENEKEALAKHNGNRELANAYLNLNQYEEALRFAKLDLDMRPENIDANELMAWIYFLKQDFANAKIHAEKMLKTQTKQANTLYKAGLIFEAAGDATKGNEYKTKATEINGNIDQKIIKASIQ